MKFKKKSVFTLKSERGKKDNEISSSRSKMSLTSTPIKADERRSVSLLDISDIPPSLQRTRINISNDSIGSTSSICKDSGYHHSEGSLISDKTRDGYSTHYKQEYFRLLDDLKFKDVLISSLHESNHNLRMKIADAENKISELRLKSQTHCRCCSRRTEESSLTIQPSRSSTRLRYSLSTFAHSEPCLFISSPPRIENATVIPPMGDTVALPADDPFSKVKQWQKSVENLTEHHNSLKTMVTERHCLPVATTPNNDSDSPKGYIRHPSDSLPKSMSYMETSRALAEVYRRKQEKTDVFSFHLIGDHSVSVSPVQLVQMNQNSKFKHCKDGYKVSSQMKSSKEESNIVHGKQQILTNLQLKNQEFFSEIVSGENFFQINNRLLP